MKALTADSYAAQLRARIYRDGWHATAKALGVSVGTLQNVCDRGQLPGDALLAATGYTRLYRNGLGRPVTVDVVRRKARKLVESIGTYTDAGKHLSLSRGQLWTLVNGTKPPTSEALDFLGFSPVFVPLDSRAE